MFQNFFKVAIRNLTRNKSFSLINILGLAIGMASAILIFLGIQYAAGADQFHTKLDRLYEVFSNDTLNGTIRTLGSTPEIMAPELKKDYPEIEAASRANWTRNLLSAAPAPSAPATPSAFPAFMSVGFTVDPDFLKMFTFPFIAGDPATALDDPHAIVITQTLAAKLFHTEDVIGRTVLLGDTSPCKVTGIMRDNPGNSFFRDMNYLRPYAQQTYVDSSWTNISIPTFVLLKPNTLASSVDSKIKFLIPTHNGGRRKTAEFLYPVSRLALHGQFVNGKESGGLISMIRTFTLIAIFIILIACINFVNLTTAYSQRRAKEVGIRKVIGAFRSALLLQFLGESLLTTFLAGLIALGIVQSALPAYDLFMQTPLHLDYRAPGFWTLFIGFILLTGILAGAWPAFVLSSFRPVAVLKGRISNLASTITPRKILVVFQFSIAIAMIISTLIVMRQVEFGQSRPVGYDRGRLVNISAAYSDNLRNHFPEIRNALLASGAAAAVTESFSPLTEGWSRTINLKFQGSDNLPPTQVNRSYETGGLVATAGMQLIMGRDIDPEHYPTDINACLINEAALAYMKFRDPIGQTIRDGGSTLHIIGVIRNYIQESPYAAIQPLIIEGAGPGNWMGAILVRLNANHPINQDLAKAETIIHQFDQTYPFEYSFVDEDYARKFILEQFSARLAGLFTALTIFISCLGLFGLAAYTARARIKEIGIRKVLGASVSSISLLLSKDFVKLITFSILVAIPIAWLTMNSWLGNYDYRIPITWDIFALAGGSALLIALATVSYQAIKAALANPVKNLRNNE